jgi:hypothetical protein
VGVKGLRGVGSGRDDSSAKAEHMAQSLSLDVYQFPLPLSVPLLLY